RPADPAHRPPREGEGVSPVQLRQSGVLAFYLCVCLMQLSHGPYYTFLTLHLESLGYCRALIGLLWALGEIA
ncbi:MFS transporter, partial [Klebsiella pneumoniae]|uniref:MFS transporter n=1 Tax=Klebsiella pneumoniae TaxID=573 RepID=UPI003967EB7A